MRHADGRALAVEMDSGNEHLFSAKFACPICNYSLPELEPRLFSFNNPMGACPKCDGLGNISFFDPKRIVAFPQLSSEFRRDQGLGQAQPVLLPDAGQPCQALRFRSGAVRSRACRKKSSRSFCTAAARKRSRSSISTSAANRHCASTPSRASSTIWNGATGKPNRPPCARSWRNISTPAPARNAMARACAWKRAMCASPTRPSTSSAPCR